MRIDPAPFVGLNHRCSQTGQVQGGKSQNQHEAFEGVRGGEATGLKLVATRFFVTESFFNVETQAVLVRGPGVRGFITGHEPGIIWLLKQAGQGQMDRPHGGSENRRLLEESTLASRGAQISDSRNRLVSEMDQGVAWQSQAKVPLLLMQVVKQPLVRKAAISQQHEQLACGQDSTHLVEHRLIGFKTDLGTPVGE